jgi:outer membrane protein insertion porin family
MLSVSLWHAKALQGYRDARILSDTITYLKDENALSIKINVEEGNKYYFGDIKF